MRIVLALLLAAALATAIWLALPAPESGASGEAATPAASAPATLQGNAVMPPTEPPPARASVAEASVPRRTSVPTRATLLLCDTTTGEPIPNTRVVLWSHRERNANLELRTDAAGLAEFAPEFLAESYGCSFEVGLPEFRNAQILRPVRTVDEVLAASPFRLQVERGVWLDVEVRDAQGRGVANAQLVHDDIDPVTTDGAGRTRVCVMAKHTVEVSAPGCQAIRTYPPTTSPWLIDLPPANRLEIELLGTTEPRGYHVDIALGAPFAQRRFRQSQYVFTPGRAVEGTSGFWTQLPRNASRWECGFNAQGRAVLDQLTDSGLVELTLWHFATRVEHRVVELPEVGGTTRVQFAAAAVDGALALRVVDLQDHPLAEVIVRLAPRQDATIDLELGLRARESAAGFPAWSPHARTDSAGRGTLPLPPNQDTLCVCAGKGFAIAVATVGELLRGGSTVRLAPDHTTEVEVRGRDNAVLSENRTNGTPAHVRPRARLPHGLWLDPASGYPPTFTFRGLPAGVIEFRFSYLPEAVLHHDTAQPVARIAFDTSAAELQLGK